jgi:hypothetical protein
MEERQDIVLGARISKQLHTKIMAERQRVEKTTGIKLSVNGIVRLLIEKGLDANGKKK